jgi:hypothetical protein
MCCNHKPCLTARGTSSSSPYRILSRLPRYFWAVSMPGCLQGPTTMSPASVTQTLTLKRTWYPRSWVGWGISRAHNQLLWTFNTPSCVKHASSVHRILCERNSSIVCRCHRYSQNSILRGRSSGHTCDTQLGWFQFSCDIAWASGRFIILSCNYGFVI